MPRLFLTMRNLMIWPVRLGSSYESIKELGATAHAAPGVALTLAAYKACDPSQDVAAHKDEHNGGFSARAYDSSVTVPFLIEKSLPRNVESHWLSQTFSFAPEFRSGLELKTVPKNAGPRLVEAVSDIEANGTTAFAESVVTQILLEKITIRNAGRVVLTRPKDLSIDATIALVGRHIAQPYRKNAPRLPQLVIYAVYQCLVMHVGRYDGCNLEPLGRMKSADRKADTIGDIVVTKSGEAVKQWKSNSSQSNMFMFPKRSTKSAL